MRQLISQHLTQLSEVIYSRGKSERRTPVHPIQPDGRQTCVTAARHVSSKIIADVNAFRQVRSGQTARLFEDPRRRFANPNVFREHQHGKMLQQSCAIEFPDLLIACTI